MHLQHLFVTLSVSKIQALFRGRVLSFLGAILSVSKLIAFFPGAASIAAAAEVERPNLYERVTRNSRTISYEQFSN